MSSLDKTKYNGSSNSILHLLRYIVLIMAFFVLGMVSNINVVEAGKVFGTKEYETLREAIDGEPGGDVILGADIEECLTIEEGEYASILLYGYNLTCNEGPAITNYGNLYLDGNDPVSSSSPNSVISSGTSQYPILNSGSGAQLITVSLNVNGLIRTINNSTLYVDDDGVIEGITTYATSTTLSSANIIVRGGTIQNGGIVFKGNLEISSGTIEGPIIANSSNITITGGMIAYTSIISYDTVDSNVITIGTKGGSVSSENPVIDGVLDINASDVIVKFYDGMIHSGCGVGQTVCLDLIAEIEHGYSTTVSSDYIKLLWSSYVEEFNDDGDHVTYHGSLSQAFRNATNGNTLKLLGHLNECVELSASKTITLDINGYSLTCNSLVDGDVTAIYNKGNLTIIGSGQILASKEDGYNRIHGIKNDGTLLIDGPTINVESIADSSTTIKDAFVIYNTGNLTIEDGVIKGTTTYVSTGPGGPATVTGIVNDGGSVVINYVKIQLVSWTHHYGVINTGGTVTINDIYFYIPEDFLLIGALNLFRNSGNLNIYGCNIEFFNKDLQLKSINYSIEVINGTVNIGKKDGIYNKNSPYLLGFVDDSGSGTINFYDGKIDGNGTYNHYYNISTNVCGSSCSTVIDDSEEGATSLVEENAVVYLRFPSIQEINSSGGHVAYHSTLNGAFGSAVNGNTIRLLEDISQCSISLGSGKTLTLDMNGKTLSCSGSEDGVYAITNSGNLTIIGDGVIDVYNEYDSWESCDEEDENGDCITWGDYYESSTYGITNNGSLTINGVAIIVEAYDPYYDSYEAPNYVYGIYCDYGSSTSFISGSIEVSSYQQDRDYYDEYETYSIYLTGTGSSLIIGIDDGNISKEDPVINGTVNSYRTTSKFYDGIIKSGNTAGLCDQYFSCSSAFTIATNATWVHESNSAYLKISNSVQEVTSSGTHVAYYSTLQSAFNSATSGNTIKLWKDLDECSVTLAAGKTLTLDLSGKNLNCITTTAISKTIINNGILTIMDSVENGQVLSRSSDSSSIVVENNGTFTLESGTLRSEGNKSNSRGVESLGTMIMNGGTIYGTAKDGYIMGIRKKTSASTYLTVNGGKIILDTTNTSAKAVAIHNESNVTTTINNVEIVLNAKYVAEGISNYGTLIVNNATIRAISTQGTAKGIHNYEVVTINNIDILARTTSTEASGLINTDRMYIKAGLIKATSTTGLTRGLYNSSSAQMEIGVNDSVVSEDLVVVYGGMYFWDNTANVSFYDGTINASNTMGYTCIDNNGVEGCSNLISTIPENYGIFEENGKAYLGQGTIVELTSSGSIVKYYSLLQEAFNIATSGNTLKLRSNLTEDGITLQSGKRLTLDMDNKTIKGLTNSGYVIINNGILTIRNGNFDSPDFPDGEWNDVNLINNTGTLSLSLVDFNVHTYYGGVAIRNAGSLNLENCSIYASSYYLSTGIYNTGTVVANDIYIGISSDFDYSIGIDNSGNVTLNNSIILVETFVSQESNPISYSIYGIRNYDNDSSLTLTNVDILVKNYGTIERYATYLYGIEIDGGVVTLDGGTIELSPSSAESIPLGISISKGTLNIGKKDGSVVYGYPFIKGELYKGTSAIINLYDGKIFGSYSSSFFNQLETGVGLMVVEGYTCLAMIEELNSSGNHVAYYTSLDEAVSGATSGNTLSLLGGVTIVETAVVIPSGKTLTLKMNGKTITHYRRDGIADFAAITNRGTLTIEGNGIITNSFDDYSPTAQDLIMNTGVLNISNLSISSEIYSGGTAIRNTGELVINGSSIYSNAYYDTAGVFNSGTLIINNSSICADSYSWAGGITAGGGGTIEIDNVTITVQGFDSEASYEHAGIYVYSLTSIEANNLNISVSSDDEDDEIGVYAMEIHAANGTINLTGGSIVVNATGRAYGAKIVSGNLTFENVNMEVTSTEESAGGIRVESGTFKMVGGTIRASDTGIGMYSNASSVIIEKGNIYSSLALGVSYGSLIIGKKDGMVESDTPYIEGDLIFEGTYSVKFYDGKIKGSCNSGSCVSVFDEIEQDAKLIEKSGYVYLESTKQNFQEVDGSGNGGKVYPTIDQAFANVANGNTIKLLDNYIGCATLASGKSVVLDLNGKSLSCNTGSNESTSVITNNGTLTLKGNGTLDVKGEGASKYGIYNTGTLIIEKGEINLKGSSLVGVYVNSGSLQMKGGTITVNSTSEEGSAKGIYIAGGSANLSGGIIQVVSSSNDVFGIHNKGNLTITKAVISATTNLGNAKGVYNESGTTTLTGGVVNATSGKGGAYGVSAYDVSQVQLSSAVNISATSTFGLALNVHSEIVNDLDNDDVGSEVKAPVLSNEVVEGIETPIVCEYGSVCDIASLTFTDYLGNSVSNVSNVITLNGEIVDSFTVLGTYIVTSIAIDNYGNASEEVVRTYNVVDTTSPVINVSKDAIVLKVGEFLSGLYGASASDNYDTDLVIETLTSEVDTSKEGTYKLTYKVVDSSGNETIVYRDVIVNGNENKENNSYIYIIGGISLFVIVAACVSLVVVRRRKNK